MPTNWQQMLFGDPGATPAPATEPGAPGRGGSASLTPTFRAKVNQVAGRLRMDPQHLLDVMRFETGGTFDPAVKNRAGSGATGLIQFMPATAQGLGTSTAALARMTPEEQLDYVEQYLRPYRGRLRSLDDTYMAVLYPAAIGKPASHVLFRQGTTAYAQNRGLDREGKGVVTVGDAVAAVGRPRQGTGRSTRETASATDWGAALGLEGARPSTPGAGSAPPMPQPPAPYRDTGVDWRQELFAPASSSTQTTTVSASPSAPAAGSTGTDWGAVLGLRP